MSKKKVPQWGKDLMEFGSSKPISRRQFMERAAYSGLGTVAATGLWTSAAEAAPVTGGHLRIGSEGGAAIDTFDSARPIGTNQITCAINAVYDRLIEIGDDGRPKAQLAESFEGMNGGKTWRVNLRKGVEFQNGKSLTTDDVIYSINYAASESSTFAEGQGILAKISNMKADGDAIMFELNGGNADFPFDLAALGFIVAPEGTSGQDWNSPGLGTGPYVLENFDPGVVASGKKNPNYYREDEGFVDSFEVLNLADVNARTTALITGEVETISRPDPKITALLSRNKEIELIQAEGNQHYTSPMRTDIAPFNDPNVRLAMKHLVNRQEILDKILFGYGYVGNDLPIGRGQQFYNDQLPQREHDPEKAKFYLKEAGLSSLDVSISAADAAFAGAVDAGVLIAESAKAAGINVSVDRVPNDGYWSEVWRKKPWCFSYWSGRPTVGAMLSAAFSSTSDWNASYWKNDRFDSLLTQALEELDDSKREEMYFEAQELLYNDSGVIVPVFASFVHAATTKLGHNGFRGNGYLDNHQLCRTGWLKG